MSGSDRPGAGQADSEAAALIEEIDREAESQKEEILADARARARGHLEAAEAAIERAAAEAARRTEKQAKIDAERLLGQVRLEAAAERLRARREAYRKAVAAARDRVMDLARGPGSGDAMRALMTEALAKVPGEARISIASRDRSVCREVLEKLGRSREIEIIDGEPGTVVVSSKDGRRKVDNSLGVRLERAALSMEALIAGSLFGTE